LPKGKRKGKGREMRTVRRIDNVSFRRLGRATNKGHAQNVAEAIRRRGYNARVIHTKTGGHGIYIGNRRKYATKFPSDLPVANTGDWYSDSVGREKDFGEMPEADDPKFAWYGDGPIDEYEKGFNVDEIEDPLEAWGELVAPDKPPAVCRKGGDCGCEGIEEDHDDRSYGCWPCPICGNDSDANFGETCSMCVKPVAFITGEEKRLLELHAKRLLPPNYEQIRFPIIMTHGTSLKNWIDIQAEGKMTAGCFATPFGTDELNIPDTFADIASDNAYPSAYAEDIFLEVVIDSPAEMKRYFQPDYEMYDMSMGVLEDEYYNDETGESEPLWKTDSSWMETLAKMNKQRDPRYLLWPESDTDWESGYKTTHTLCIRDTIPVSKIRVREGDF